MTKQTESTNHEVDLDAVSKKVKNFLSGINDSFFEGILFIKKYSIVVIALVLIGAGYGYYKDSITKTYQQKILVTPNFGSADYLYEQIKSLNAKIVQRDTVFLKGIGINDSKHVAKIEIEPIVDIYNYVTEENGLNIIQRENVKFSLFRQIADKRDMTEVLEEQATAKNYKNHLITITTSGEADKKEMVQPMLDYLNSSSYFKEIQKESVKSLEVKIAENDSMVKQANIILSHMSQTGSNSSTVLLNEKTGLNDILVIKDQLIRQQASNKIKMIDYGSIVKETAAMLNIKKHTILSGKMKFIYPFVLLLLFFAVMSFRRYYITQTNKRKVILEEKA